MTTDRKINQKEYLKKYLSLGSQSKEKKKKKKPRTGVTRLTIVDDDLDLKALAALKKEDAELYNLSEDAPQIVAIIDERPEEIIRLEEYRASDKWKILDSDQEKSAVLQSVSNTSQRENGKTDIEYTIHSDDEKDPKHLSRTSVRDDLSPLRRKTNCDYTRHLANKNDSDLSPPRKSRVEDSCSDSSPPRRQRKASDSDLSPPRKSKKSDRVADSSPRRKHRRSPDSDLSPPRKSKKSGRVADSSPRRKHRQSPDSDLSPPRRSKFSGRAADLSSPRRKHRRSPDSALSPPRRKHRQSPDSDLSPPRKGKKSVGASDFSPARRKNRPDSDLSPQRRKHRQSPDSDLSPPRRKHRQSPDSDLSPPRRKHRQSPDSDLSPPRRKHRQSPDSDLSPPRRNHRQSPPKKSKKSVSASNLSPPRKSKTSDSVSDASHPRRKQRWDLDTSEAPRSKEELTKEVNKQHTTFDSNLSPPRTKHKNTRDISEASDINDSHSPTSGRQSKLDSIKWTKVEVDEIDPDDPDRVPKRTIHLHDFSLIPNFYGTLDPSLTPPLTRMIYNYLDEDVSPSTKSKSRDNSDSSRSHQKLKDSYQRESKERSKYSSLQRMEEVRSSHSSSRQSQRSSKHDDSDDSSSTHRVSSDKEKSKHPPLPATQHREKENTNTAQKLEKTLEGKKAGLLDAKSLRDENAAFKQKENEMFSKMSDDISGRGAATVVRDRKTGRRKNEAEDERKKKEEEEKAAKNKAKYDKWGKGLKQVEDRTAKLHEDLHEMNKPLARYADDLDLEKHLKDQDREGDPMLEYMKKKKTKPTSGGKRNRVYEGSYPPNRYGIRPGYRWDGVDRSSGYEKQWFECRNAKKAVEEEAYKWSVSDM